MQSLTSLVNDSTKGEEEKELDLKNLLDSVLKPFENTLSTEYKRFKYLRSTGNFIDSFILMILNVATLLVHMQGYRSVPQDGNFYVFRKLIDDLNEMASEGIEVEIDGKLTSWVLNKY
ncbi:hypothetical protein FOCC_FOCC016846 [Frankliniella occidentalis]|nr:hypothetical protein FOCC_FOCC016846 [Frankliniella occidentalis]